MNTMKNDCRIRLETPADYREVENLTREAFWNVYRPGCLEHYILHSYRGKPDFVPELDFVLEKNGTIIGHVMYVRSEIAADDGRRIPIMTFGPISIAPGISGWVTELFSCGIRWTRPESAERGRWRLPARSASMANPAL